MRERKCKNWLKSLMDYIEETETPRHFWLWGGISTIASALQRKIWLNFGIDNLYPNLYVMIVAAPGRCRKSVPLKFSKKILMDIDIPLFSDSPTKRHLTSYLNERGKVDYFQLPGIQHKIQTMSAASIVSAEMGSFFAVDPKAMIDCITDLYDCPDEWIYSTHGAGEDKLYGVCINAFWGTTPKWLADNLPDIAVEGGFTSRTSVISGTDKYKYIPIPPILDEEQYKNLRDDLAYIAQLKGEMKFEGTPRELYETWYMTIEGKVKATHDERAHSFLERIHTTALKIAMINHLAYSNELVILENDIKAGIATAEQVLEHAPIALSGQGKSKYTADEDKIIGHIRMFGEVKYGELMKIHRRNLDKPEFDMIIDKLEAMELIKWGEGRMITWAGGAEKGTGGKPRKKKDG